MEKARITICQSDGELQIWLNPAGRDLLVKKLLSLSASNDHFHFMPEDMDGELPVRRVPYSEGDGIIEWGKVLFRPDEWDAQHYPHVLATPPARY